MVQNLKTKSSQGTGGIVKNKWGTEYLLHITFKVDAKIRA